MYRRRTRSPILPGVVQNPPEDDEDEMQPGDSDYDLSEARGYGWEPERPAWPIPPWAMVLVTLLVVLALVLPTLLIALRYG